MMSGPGVKTQTKYFIYRTYKPVVHWDEKLKIETNGQMKIGKQVSKRNGLKQG